MRELAICIHKILEIVLCAFLPQLNAGSSDLTKTLSITGHTSPVTCVDWLHGRRSLSTCITGSLDATIKITNLLKTTES